MIHQDQRPDIGTLQKFEAFRALSPEQLDLLARHLLVKTAKPGQRLIERGSFEQFNLFLVDGTLHLEAEDGKVSEIDTSSPNATRPIASLLPRKYAVTAATPVRYIQVANDFMPRLPEADAFGGVLEGIEVAGDLDYDQSETQLAAAIYKDLTDDRLALPSLPDVAIRVGQALEDETSSAKTIARIVETDPSITAKIVKAANSAYYGGYAPVDNTPDAVVRLGMKVTHNLVLAYTLRDLFKSKSKTLQKHMQELWQHSTRVAAICYMMVRKIPQLRQFNPDEAMLQGLLHDIGVAAIINRAANYPTLAGSDEAIHFAMQNLRGVVGGAIMEAWRFPHDFVITAIEAETWQRGEDGEADYCDLVIIAQLHSYIGTEQAKELPHLNEVSALTRLGLGELSPRQSISILEAAQEQIEQTQSLLQA